MDRVPLRGFGQIAEDVREARRWYTDLGITTEGTRLAAIDERVSELLRDIEVLTHEEVVAKWYDLDTYYALADGAGFGKIARELPRVGPNLLPRNNLRRIIQGPVAPGDETPGDGSVDARNIFMELELGADLLAKDLQVTGFEDLRFRFEGLEYVVQCKRLLSPSQVRHNIDLAYGQLRRGFRSDYERGLIALQVDKLMGLEGKTLRVERGRTPADEVRRLVEDFREGFGHQWWNFIDIRVIGIVLVFRFLCYLVEQDAPAIAYYVAIANLAAPEALQAADLERLRRLTAHLSLHGGT